jgi:Tfp pilus assembly protein PilO
MKKKLLPWIIALSALSVSGSAAFYSVTGLGKMFAGASLQVMVLAGSLEFAKLVTASLLYQYWKKLNLGLKLYLSIATLILIIITSAGIYGFLSSAYQETSFKVQNQDKNIQILDKNISIIKTEIVNYESQIKQKNDRLGQLTTIRTNLQSTQDVLIEKSKSTNAVRQQIKDVDGEIKRMDSEISILNDSISSKNTRISSIEQEKFGVSSNADLAKEVGPLKYIAKLTGSDIDSVVNWYIIILMLVFDPLAIALVIAANFAFEMSEKKEEEEEMKNENKENSIKNIWNRIKKIRVKNNEDNSKKIIEEPYQEDIIEESVIDHIAELDNEKTEESSELDPIENEEDLKISEDPDTHNENVEKDTEKDENKEENSDKYNDEIMLGKKRIERERFRSNPDYSASRKNFRNNPGGEDNPLNLK